MFTAKVKSTCLFGLNFKLFFRLLQFQLPPNNTLDKYFPVHCTITSRTNISSSKLDTYDEITCVNWHEREREREGEIVSGLSCGDKPCVLLWIHGLELCSWNCYWDTRINEIRQDIYHKSLHPTNCIMYCECTGYWIFFGCQQRRYGINENKIHLYDDDICK